MIIDGSQLAGLDAYLVTRDTGDPLFLEPSHPDHTNLAAPHRAGRTIALKDGHVLSVNAIDLVLEAEDPAALLARQAHPFLTVSVRKEMFPSLYADPYRHRVHTVAGGEDFLRGELVNMRLMEVDGYQTLVSTGTEKCRWMSPLYRMPEPVTFAAAAWDLATTRLTPVDGFQYFVKIHYWTEGHEALNEADRKELLLAGSADPHAGRMVREIPAAPSPRPLSDVLTGLIAYRLEFGAVVKHDAFLQERHSGGAAPESLGRPLLRAVSLLEQRPSALAYFSLAELLAKSSDYFWVEEAGGPPKKILARLDIRASLSKGEWIELSVRPPASGALTLVEARVDAMMHVRPPEAETPD